MVPKNRAAPIDMSPDEFRAAGHKMVDTIAEFLASLPQRTVTPGKSPREIRKILGNQPLPQTGAEPGDLLEEAADLLINYSTFNGHPRFWGFITSSAAPIGALGDFLAGAINPNVGGWALSPMASEIEAQTVRWIAELIGFPSNSGGLMVSGGNMANFIGFLCARKAKTDWEVRKEGLLNGGKQLYVYVSRETHTWIEKATDLFGLGTNSIRWIPTDRHQRMDTAALRRRIKADLDSGGLPFIVVGTAGSVGTGAVDPLSEIAEICREHNLWFHVDGAYGAPAAAVPDAPKELKALNMADSIALDPHKWLYSPLEAGCVLVRNPKSLSDAFRYHPTYYHTKYYNVKEEGGDAPINYHELGIQNSRGFRALKVWLALRQIGREGCQKLISDDMELARGLYKLADEHPELEAFTQNLSITTFRYRPAGLGGGEETIETYLNDLNSELLEKLQEGGEAYLSNAVIDGKFLLRACVVNFRTTMSDFEALIKIVTRIGREIDSGKRPDQIKKP